jgi:hypothetical protein
MDNIESIMKKKADPIGMKWYDDEVINNRDCKHLDIQERSRSDSITTSTVHNVNIVEMTISYHDKASDGDTVLDGKNVSPIKLGGQKEQSCQHSESINWKVTKGNRLLNHTRKTPATRSDDFYGKIKCNEF